MSVAHVAGFRQQEMVFTETPIAYNSYLYPILESTVSSWALDSNGFSFPPSVPFSFSFKILIKSFKMKNERKTAKIILIKGYFSVTAVVLLFSFLWKMRNALHILTYCFFLPKDASSHSQWILLWCTAFFSPPKKLFLSLTKIQWSVSKNRTSGLKSLCLLLFTTI